MRSGSPHASAAGAAPAALPSGPARRGPRRRRSAPIVDHRRRARSAAAWTTASTSSRASATARTRPRAGSCRPSLPSRGPASRDALEFGPVAPQPANGGRPMSEDCLHLNVWTPALARQPQAAGAWCGSTAARYSSGTSNEIETDGARLSRRGDVVVVTVNHRLNAFGYLYLREFGGADLADSGNAGMLDLVLALRVGARQHRGVRRRSRQRHDLRSVGRRREVRDADGDAGGRGLFHRVMTHERPADHGQPRDDRHRSCAAAARRAAADRRIASIELRTLPMEQLVKVSRAPAYLGPVKDGRSLPRDPFDPDAPPQSAHIPMILGNTHGETRTLIGRGDPSMFALTWETLQAKLEANSPFMGDSRSRQGHCGVSAHGIREYSPADVFFAATTTSRSWRGQVIEAERRAAQPAGAAPHVGVSVRLADADRRRQVGRAPRPRRAVRLRQRGDRAGKGRHRRRRAGAGRRA